MILCCKDSFPESLPDGMRRCELAEYMSRKTGPSLASMPEELLRITEAEALRDLIVMSEVTGRDTAILLTPRTLLNPECLRLIHDHCPEDPPR